MRTIKQTLKEYASFSQEMELTQHHKQHLWEKKMASLKIVNRTPPCNYHCLGHSVHQDFFQMSLPLTQV